MFKSGDKVVCVEARGSPSLVEGKIYTVKKGLPVCNCITLEETGDNYEWHTTRFKKAGDMPMQETIKKVSIKIDYSEDDTEVSISGKLTAKQVASILDLLYSESSTNSFKFKDTYD